MEASEIKQKVYQDLNEVIDPELGIGIVDLGLIYDVKVLEDQSKIVVEMTLTSQNCPMAGFLPEIAGDRLRMGYPQHIVELNIVWSPAWTQDMITENGRMLLGMG